MNAVEPTTSASPPVWRWPLLAGAAWLLLLLVAELIGRQLLVMPTLCVFRRLTGVPCPTCGATRAVRAAAAGHGWEAIAFNPGLAAVALLGVAWVGLRLCGRSWPRPRRRLTWWVIAILGVTAFAANWAYVIWRDLPPAV
ncbi:MAG: DUF2752 domain-containing protein [Phycisphaerales bacterium]|nr:DUF2752 domain-containing protein [Phycisphaerales bacterium]